MGPESEHPGQAGFEQIADEVLADLMPLSNENCIKMFVHCGRCIDEILKGAEGGVSPRDYARLEVGWTKQGLQVWCKRHECNVMHVDFEGRTHPANTTVPA